MHWKTVYFTGMENPFLYTLALFALLCVHVCESSKVNTIRILAMSNDKTKKKGIHAELERSAAIFRDKFNVDIEFKV